MPVQTARRRLGKALKHEREVVARLTQEQVHDRGGPSETTLWRIENGSTTVKLGTVYELCEIYGSLPETQKRLTELAAGTKDTKDQADGSTAAWVQVYFDLEQECEALAYWSSWIVHALLQTDGYARAVLASDNAPEEVIQARLRKRAARQNATLTRSCTIDVVLAQGVFTQLDLGADILNEQYQHLCEMTDQPGISIRILPAMSGLHEGVWGPFSILDFEDELDPALVYLEDITGAQYLDRSKYVDRYRSVFTQLKELSTPIKEFAL